MAFVAPGGGAGTTRSVDQITQSTTTVTSDHDDLIVANTAAFTLTLPAVAGADRILLIVKRSTYAQGVVTLDGNGSEEVVRDGVGATTLPLIMPGEWVRLWDDGTSWVVVDSNIPRIGDWHLIEVKTGPATPAQSLDFDATLDEDLWTGYRISGDVKNESASQSLLKLRINGATGAGNRMFAITAATAMSVGRDTSFQMGNVDAGARDAFHAEMLESHSDQDNRRWDIFEFRDNTTSIDLKRAGLYMTTPAAGVEITSLGITGSQSDTIGDETTIRLRGRRAV